ncbi:hypothetical protein ROJ8625_01333 [Roseivivax jejudonensis]|uniref:Uncharacterized protein n=1 Tax=Roseivivax jejudonensis TaxID=1529041 RepID=A0A1X6YS57_9RHOB|nr:hypothetical protein [Roseivivax jejudonensis]SLN29905.1 hypothetical protein ROJ8625_01333 [Roseivivax jejudonensis]
MIRALVLLCSLPLPAWAGEAEPARGLDCYCTDSIGDRVELGEVICLSVGGRDFTAQCQMSLNVPMWREVSEGCVAAALPRRAAARLAALRGTD